MHVQVVHTDVVHTNVELISQDERCCYDGTTCVLAQQIRPQIITEPHRTCV